MFSHKKRLCALFCAVFVVLSFLFNGISHVLATETLPVTEFLNVLEECYKTENPTNLAITELTEKCLKETDYGASVLREIREVVAKSDSPRVKLLADGLVAEIIWRIFAKKKWNDALCLVAAEILDSPDSFAVAYADWALSMRVGWENSSEKVPWNLDMEQKPLWFAKWLAVPAERFPELDYWRIAGHRGVHRSLDMLRGSARKFLSRTEGLYQEMLAGGKLSDTARKMTDEQYAEAKRILEEIQKTDDLFTARQLFTKMRLTTREIVLANPDLDFQEILFTKRHSAHGLRNITGSQYPWTHKPGGDLCVKTGFNPQDPVRDVLQGQLGPGHVHGTDLHWDGKRVVFGYAQQPVWPLPRPTHTNDAHWFFELRPKTPPLHLYEVNLDGSGLRQITSDPYWGDFEPTYAADGGIVFASDRSSRSSECGNFNADHSVINLHRCNADGSGIRMLSDNKDIDRYPRALSNGLIGYTRWEYQERHFTEVHAFWTIRPDGTYAEAAYKQHFGTPWGLRDVRDIPGTNRYVAIATGHHTLAYGQIVLFDLLGGPNDASRMTAVTPSVTTGEGPSVTRPVPEGGQVDNVGRYSGPYPVSESVFLASWSSCVPAHDGRLGGDTQFAIYLVDVYGNRELVHRERILSCDFATPIKARQKPYEIADGRILSPVPMKSETGSDAEKVTENATKNPVSSGKWVLTQKEKQTAVAEFPHPIAYVSDVNVGLPAEEQGKAKYLRVMQHVAWPMDDKIGAMRWAPGNAWEQIFGYWAWAPTREIGTVPIEADGSCWFYLPANTPVYFQILDENRLEIRRMRSHITLENGESRGCIGCHETRPQVVAPKPGSLAQAFQHAPLIPEEPKWGSETLLGFEEHIQPIFERNCVSCHSPENADGPDAPAARFDLTATTDPVTGMMRSYTSLFPHGKRSGALVSTEENMQMVSVSNKHSGASISAVRQFGSSRSRLVRVLLDDPLHAEQVRPKITEDEWIRLVTWIDGNAPYYTTFFNRRDPENPGAKRSISLTFPVSIHAEK